MYHVIYKTKTTLEKEESLREWIHLRNILKKIFFPACFNFSIKFLRPKSLDGVFPSLKLAVILQVFRKKELGCIVTADQLVYYLLYQM